jgi:hypothetical protein
MEWEGTARGAVVLTCRFAGSTGSTPIWSGCEIDPMGVDSRAMCSYGYTTFHTMCGVMTPIPALVPDDAKSRSAVVVRFVDARS